MTHDEAREYGRKAGEAFSKGDAAEYNKQREHFDAALALLQAIRNAAYREARELTR